MADSLIVVLKNGADFKELALLYSTDNTTYQAGGEIMEFGVGRYAPAFEQAAFALDKDGAVSAPFETEYGAHIIKRIKRSPLPADLNDKNFQESLRTQVLQSDRMNVAKNILFDKIKKDVSFKLTLFRTHATGDRLWRQPPAGTRIRRKVLTSKKILYSF